MNYIDHDHKHTVQRGGTILSGSSNFDDSVVINTPEYNKFDQSNTYRATGKLGTINPCLQLHTLPGDSFRMSPSLFQRFQPLISPIITPVETSLHTFYVPFRKLDYSFEQWITGGVDGKFDLPLLNFHFDENTDYPVRSSVVPSYGLVNGKYLYGVGSLLDDFEYGSWYTSFDEAGGVQTSRPTRGDFNLFPLIAYHRIYNDYYRAEEIETDLWMPNYHHSIVTYGEHIKDVFQDNFAFCQDLIDFLHNDPLMQGFAEYMLRRMTDPAYRQNRFAPSAIYFNHAKNTVDVSMLFASFLKNNTLDNVAYIEWSDSTNSTDICLLVFVIYLLSAEVMPWERDRFTTALPYLQRGSQEFIDTHVRSLGNISVQQRASITTNLGSSTIFDTGIDNSVRYYGNDSSLPNSSSLVSTSSGKITMDDIRRLNAATRFLEKSARIGYRFSEWLQGLFGVDTKSPSHLEKPVYIGGLKGSAQIDTVFNTADTQNAVLGDYAGSATSFSSSDYFDFASPEYGIIIGVYGTKPRTSYINSVDRNHIKFHDRTTIYTPDFAHLQEQPIFGGELDASYLNSSSTNRINGIIQEDDPSQFVDFFGYEPRYNEYRYKNSTTHGELLSSLRYFTNSRLGSSEVSVDSRPRSLANDYDFQHVSPLDDAVNRIFAVDSVFADHFIAEISWNISKLSLVASQATPML